MKCLITVTTTILFILWPRFQKNISIWALVVLKSTVVLEKTLESPLDCKEIQPVHPKGDQSWVFTERTDAKAETPILWPPDGKNWLVGKDPDAGKDWGQDEKGTTEDEMAGWHHWLDGHEFEWTLGVGDGQGGLVGCCHGITKSQSQLSDWTEIAGRELSSTHQQKIGLKIHWAWPHPSEQDPIFPSVSLSHQEASISLLSFSIREQTDWKPQSHN